MSSGQIGVIVLLGANVEGQMSASLEEYPGVEVIDYCNCDVVRVVERVKAIWNECVRTVPRRLFLYVHYGVLHQNPSLVSALTHVASFINGQSDWTGIELITYGIPFETDFCWWASGDVTYVLSRGGDTDEKNLLELEARAIELGGKKARE